MLESGEDCWRQTEWESYSQGMSLLSARLLSDLLHHLLKTRQPEQQPSLLQLALNRKPEGSVERKCAVTPGGPLFLVYCLVCAYVPRWSDPLV